MIIYGSSLSPFVRKVLAFAGEKGIDVELVGTRPGDDNPDFRSASPFGKMPAMKDGDYRLADSSAIAHYLDSKYPDPNLIPLDPEERGRTIWYDEFADTILGGCGAKMFFNRIVAPVFMGKPGDLDAASAAEREELPKILDYLETVVPDAGGYLVADRLTLADIAVASPFANLRHLSVDVEEARYPRTRMYVESILARQSFAPWIEREAALLARMTEPAQ